MLRLERLECRENPAPVGPKIVDPTGYPEVVPSGTYGVDPGFYRVQPVEAPTPSPVNDAVYLGANAVVVGIVYPVTSLDVIATVAGKIAIGVVLAAPEMLDYPPMY